MQNLSLLTLHFWLILIGVNLSLPSIVSSEPRHDLLETRVEAWLKLHQGKQNFKIISKEHLTGSSSIELQHDEQKIDLWQERDVFKHGHLALDDYEVTHKSYQPQPPYRLLHAEMYRIHKGEAQIAAWRAMVPGQTQGEWRFAKAPLLRRSDRSKDISYVALKSADKLWKNPNKGQSLSVSETLESHLGFSFSQFSDPLTLSILTWGKSEQFTLRQIDRRLSRTDPTKPIWQELLEVKLVTESGEVSRTVQNLSGQLYLTSLSDQLSLIPSEKNIKSEYLDSKVYSLNNLQQASGKLQEKQLQQAMQPARKDFESCSQNHNPQRHQLTTLTLRLHLNQQGELKSIALKDLKQWGAFERCVVQAVTKLQFSSPKDGDALVFYPVRFQATP